MGLLKSKALCLSKITHCMIATLLNYYTTPFSHYHIATLPHFQIINELPTNFAQHPYQPLVAHLTCKHFPFRF